ncbi:hypothetical protein ACYPKM_02280 [Pseudomonas aeruginosa]
MIVPNSNIMKVMTDDGDYTNAPYDEKLLGFVHGNAYIRNPFFSPDGRSRVSPQFYGFVLTETGGGCEAWTLPLSCGGQLMLTDDGGCYLPDENYWESALLGRYRQDGSDIGYCVLGEITTQGANAR